MQMHALELDLLKVKLTLCIKETTTMRLQYISVIEYIIPLPTPLYYLTYHYIGRVQFK